MRILIKVIVPWNHKYNKTFRYFSDILEERLLLAKKMGADHILQTGSSDPRYLSAEVERILGDKPEFTIECSGAETSIQMAVYVDIT